MVGQTLDVQDAVDVKPSAPPAWRRRLWHVAVWTFVLSISIVAIVSGLQLRKWAWNLTYGLRFIPDIAHRGYVWAHTSAGSEGYLNLYDKMSAQDEKWSLYLDYAPLRLGVMNMWGRWNHGHVENPQVWQPQYEFNRPVLWFNAGMELMGAICAFFLVRLWLIRAASGTMEPSFLSTLRYWWRRQLPPSLPAITSHRPFTGWAAGLVAALLLWFNPAMIASAHAWPTWDAWVVPMYLLSILLASYDCWLLAGFAVALGTMFKGQQLLGASVLVAWTILNARFDRTLRCAAGFVLGIAAVASPWLLTRINPGKLQDLLQLQKQSREPWFQPVFDVPREWNVGALVWVLCVLIALLFAPMAWNFVRRNYLDRKRNILLGAVLVTSILLLAWPVMRPGIDWTMRTVLLFGAACAVALTLFGPMLLVRKAHVSGAGIQTRARALARRLLFPVTCASIALLLSIPLFNASSAWWDEGVMFGTRQVRMMHRGLTSNLAGILVDRHRWSMNNIDTPAMTITPGMTLGILDQPYVVTIEHFLKALFIVMLVPCLWGVARHARRNDPRFLVAVTAPWLMFFCFPTQIHGRYLLFAAGIGMICIGQSVGMLLLAMLLSMGAWVMIMGAMLRMDGARSHLGYVLNARSGGWFELDVGHRLAQWLEAAIPDMGHGILLIALVFVYMSVTSSRRNAKHELPRVGTND